MSDATANGVAMDVVGKNQDQAGLAESFRTQQPTFQNIPTFESSSIDINTFRTRYTDNNVPVVLKGALSDWKCTQWNVPYLKETVGHALLPVRVNPTSDGTFGDAKRLEDGDVSLYDFDFVQFDHFLDSLDTSPAKYYPARVEICEDLPELVPDIPSFYDLPWRFAFGCPYKNGSIVYFGPGQQSTPIHYDTLENLTFMARGTKTFTLFPPSESHRMSPSLRSLGTHYSLLSIKDILDADVISYKVLLEEGDMLYLPNCWWHGVQGGDGFNVSLNYWFHQHPDKEDTDVYRRYLTSAFDRTLKQLASMQLPKSVMEEAQNDAASSIESKIQQRCTFSWSP